MEPRVLKTQQGQYALTEWGGVNQSGITPVCDKVLVLVDKSMEVTAGAIYIPEDQQERQTLSATTGVLVAVGPQAFAYDAFRTVHWVGERPQVGDRVVFTRYAGQEYSGYDGSLYRLMEDRQIGGIMRPVETEDGAVIVAGETAATVAFVE